VLVQEASRLGVDLRLNADVKDVRFEDTKVYLRNGEEVSGDVIVAADGKGLSNVEVRALICSQDYGQQCATASLVIVLLRKRPVI